MKKFLFVSYVATVLLISTQARADIYFQTAAQIEAVSFDPSTLEMTVSGTLSNPCASTGANIVQDQQNPQVLLLTVTSIPYQGSCIAVLQDYQEVISIPALVKAAQIEINPALTYSVRTSNYNFQFEVSGAQLL